MPQNTPVGPDKQSIQNASQKPRIYYGIHFYPGVAQYPGFSPNGEPRRLLVTEEAIRNMEPTFTGCPVYVGHVGEVDLSTIDSADGYVIRSFFNEADGQHWAEFIVKTDRGHEAITRGWGLSNAYRPTECRDGGVWNSVPYEQEVVRGEFEHLAIVEQPRYNSAVLTPEQFHSYNKTKLEELERIRVRNEASKKGTSFMFGLFKKTPVEGIDKDTLVTLKNGQVMSLETLVNSYDVLVSSDVAAPVANGDSDPESQPTPISGGAANEAEEKKGEEAEAPKKEEHKTEEKPEEKGEEGGASPAPEEKKEGEEKPAEGAVADPSHHVMVNGEKLTVKDLVSRHEEMANCMNALAAHYGRLMMPKNSSNSSESSEPKEIKNEEDEFMSSVSPASKGAPIPVDHFAALASAHRIAEKAPAAAPADATSGVARGAQRYGSRK